MIHIPPLTSEVLHELHKEFPGCVFSGKSEGEFLTDANSRDVQAVPGNGKTTLLAAKLALLSRSWSSPHRGVCVISHTNAACEEIEKKLATHPRAAAFLRYPHFIGTVTAFIDRYIALPYLRGLGWPIQRIDDDVFAAVALSQLKERPALVKYASGNGGKNRRTLEGYLILLELAPDFECVPEKAPQRLKIRHRKGQPGPGSDTGSELEKLKAKLAGAGFYRFADMTALAEQAIDRCPSLLVGLHTRFPLVLLDEAQDTAGAQLALLERIFGAGVAYQRLGDQNQTLYEDDELTPEDYWKARDGVIPLEDTRRFGTEIAAFTSRLTVRARQQIRGVEGQASRRSLILFDRDSIDKVLPTYAAEVRSHWGEKFSSSLDIRAVASRHKPAGARGGWPKTLIDYYPRYRSGSGHQSRPDTLCCAMRQAALLHQSRASPADVVDLMTAGLVALLRRQATRDDLGNLVGKRTLKNVLSAQNPSLFLMLRRQFRDRVLLGEAVWSPSGWQEFCDELTALLEIDGKRTAGAEQFMAFVQEGAEESGGQTSQHSRTVAVHNGVEIKLGSIHSVKGKTVDAVLIVETEIWRGPARDESAMDLATVLPHAFGLEDRDFNSNVAQLAAATNIFVAATRPRQVLSCALRKDAASDALISTAREQGWLITDVTSRPPIVPAKAGQKAAARA